MAAPVPETDSGLPRRTTVQPPVPNSPPASGEAAVTSEPKIPRPDPFAKPLPRPALSSKPNPAPASTATSETSPATSATPTAADLGLTPKSPRRGSWKYKIASALGLLLSAGGGYFGYQKYYPKSDVPAPEQQDSELADADGVDRTADPFDDPLKMSDDDSLGEPATREPRRMGQPPKAAPITRHHAAATAPKHGKHKSAIPDDDSLDMLDDSDDSGPPRITQSEPPLDDEDLTGPSLQRPSTNHRKIGIASRSDNRGTTNLKPAHRPAAGPRIHANNSLDGDLPADITDDLTADKLDGYDLARPKHTKKSAASTQGPKISVIDVRDEADADERIDGFTADESTTHRAVSKTRIVRSTSSDALDGSRMAADDDNDPGFSRSTRGGMTPIHRRGSTPTEGRVRAHRPQDDDFSDSVEAVSEMYRVQSNDSFWSISRKQYGSARYYQALMRHNLDRVPDPQKLRPGTQVSTPSTAFLEQKYPDLIEKAPASAHQPASHGTATRSRFERPVAERGSDRFAETATANAAADGYFYSKSGEPMYRVGADDTLTGIAQKHLGRASRWTEIYEQNQDILNSPDNLTLGTVIRLPSDASRLSLVPENDRRR